MRGPHVCVRVPCLLPQHRGPRAQSRLTRIPPRCPKLSNPPSLSAASFLFPLPSLLPSPLLQSQRIENDRLPLFKFNSLFFSQISEKNAFSIPKQVHKIVKARLYPIPPSPGLLPPSFSQVQFTLCISVLAIPESDTTLSILHLFEPEGVLMTKLQVFFDVREVFRAM